MGGEVGVGGGGSASASAGRASPTPVFTFADDSPGTTGGSSARGGGGSGRTRSPRGGGGRGSKKPSSTGGPSSGGGVGGAPRRSSPPPPPPRSTLLPSLGPTAVSVTGRGGMDDVHPLALTRSSTDPPVGSVLPRPAAVGRWRSAPGSGGAGGSFGGGGSASGGGGGGGSKLNATAPTAGASWELNPLQRHAMDAFLAAQKAGDDMGRQEAWAELVSAMKDGGPFGGGGGLPRPRGKAGSRGSKSLSSGKDDILGLIQIGGGPKVIGVASDVVSITSGLTSGTSNTQGQDTWDGGGGWAPSPGASPTRSGVEEEGGRGHGQARGHVPARGQAATTGGGTGAGRQVVWRSVTPPNVPNVQIPGGKGDLPLVSPLSLEGGEDEEEEEGNLLDVTGETTIATPEGCLDGDDGSSGNHSNNGRGSAKKTPRAGGKRGDERKCSVFFDIRSTFKDNARRLRTDPASDPRDPTLALADLSDDDSDDSDDSEDDVAGWGGASPRREAAAPAIPSPTRADASGALPLRLRPAPAAKRRSDEPRGARGVRTWDDDGWDTLASSAGLLARANDGEVVSFREAEREEEMEEAPLFEASFDAHFGPSFEAFDEVKANETLGDPEVDDSKVNETFSSNAAVQGDISRWRIRPKGQTDAARTSSVDQSSSREQPSLSLDPSSSQDLSTSRSSRRRTRRRDPNSTAPSLEEQILSVLQQQADSHIVEEDEEDGDEDEEVIAHEEGLFGRSSPLSSPPARTKKSRAKGGTVGSAASAQDILNELRSATPSTLRSGGSLRGGGEPPRSALPSSISVGGPPSQRPDGGATVSCGSPSEGPSERSSPAGAPVHSHMRASPAPVLAPSKRDSPRPGRPGRGSSSEPLPDACDAARATARSPEPATKFAFVGFPAAPDKTTGPALSVGSNASSKIGGTTGSSARSRIDSATGSNASNTSAASTQARNNRTRTSGSSGAGPEAVESPLQRYRRAAGVVDSGPAGQASGGRLRSRLFPNTNPVADRGSPDDTLSSNPFDSPPRLKATTNPFDSPSGPKEEPFEGPSSPILQRSGERSHEVEVQGDPCALERSAATSSSTNKSSLDCTALSSSACSDSEHPDAYISFTSSQAVDLSTSVTSDQAVSLPREKSIPPTVASRRPPPPPPPPAATAASRPSVAPRSIPPPSSLMAAAAARRGESRDRRADIDEIRSSIAQLKDAGVGGLGKPTSTLVRDGATGRYVIRDVDDARYEDAVRGSPGDASREEEEGGSPLAGSFGGRIFEDVPVRKEPAAPPPMFAMSDGIPDESVLDDDAVDDALLLLSSTTSLSAAESEQEPSAPGGSAPPPASARGGGGEQIEDLFAIREPPGPAPPASCPTGSGDSEEEDLFVVRRPATTCGDGWGWDAKPSSTALDWGDDLDPDGEDGESFAAGPEWDCSDDGVNDGNGYQPEDWGEEVLGGGKSFFPSPTSVTVSKRRLFMGSGRK